MIAKLLLSCLLIGIIPNDATRYEPTWESLDTRPNPPWFDDVKYGIMMHWGVFSVPSFGHEWFWYYWKTQKDAQYVDFVKDNYRPDWTYADFAKQLTTEFYDPNQWADIIEASGAKYTAITTKHHEGYAMWPTKYSYSWNAMAVGPQRDLIGEFAQAIRKKPDVHFGIYYSLYEWYNPLYLMDKASGYKTQKHVEQKVMPQLYELINTYQPDFLWSDGDWEAPSSYWNSTEFIAWLYNDSPVKDKIVTNDRWGIDANCKHGGYITCHDKYNPKVLQKRKWEDVQLCDRHCAGFRREAVLADIFSPLEILTYLVEAVSCGGNLILNVGITKEGRITPIFEERLRQVGGWLKVNGDAIYGTTVWKYQNDTVNSKVWYTMKKTTVYAIALYWPGPTLHLGAVQPSTATTVKLMGYPDNFKWAKSAQGGIDITVPAIPFNKMPCQWAFVFEINGLE